MHRQCHLCGRQASSMWIRWKRWLKCGNNRLISRVHLAPPNVKPKKNKMMVTLTIVICKITLQKINRKMPHRASNPSIWSSMRWVPYLVCVIQKNSVKCLTKCSFPLCRLIDWRRRRGLSGGQLKTLVHQKLAQAQARERLPGSAMRQNRD